MATCFRPSQTVFNKKTSSLICRIRNAAHLSLCVIQVATVSWALLTPDPFEQVRATSMDWVENVSDLLIHGYVFTVMSFTVFSLGVAIYGDIPPIAVFSVLGYCIVVEGLQAFVPGRYCDPRDAIANVTGFLLGVATVRILERLRPTTAT
jgi:VanZ family protein